MHAPQRAFALIERNVALNHLRVQPVCFEFLSAKSASKKPALIFVFLQFDHECAGQFNLRKNQVSPTARIKSCHEVFACSTCSESSVFQRRSEFKRPEASRP